MQRPGTRYGLGSSKSKICDFGPCYLVVCNVSAEQVLFIALQQMFGPLMLMFTAWPEEVGPFSLLVVICSNLLAFRGICLCIGSIVCS